MLRHSLVTQEGEKKFIDLYRALLSRECSSLSLFVGILYLTLRLDYNSETKKGNWTKEVVEGIELLDQFQTSSLMMPPLGIFYQTYTLWYYSIYKKYFTELHHRNKGLSKKTTCLRGFEAAWPKLISASCVQSFTAEASCQN